MLVKAFILLFFASFLVLSSHMRESVAHGDGHSVNIDCRRVEKGYKPWLFYREDEIPKEIRFNAGKKVSNIKIYDDQGKELYDGPPVKKFAIDRSTIKNILVMPIALSYLTFLSILAIRPEWALKLFLAVLAGYAFLFVVYSLLHSRRTA